MKKKFKFFNQYKKDFNQTFEGTMQVVLSHYVVSDNRLKKNKTKW